MIWNLRLLLTAQPPNRPTAAAALLLTLALSPAAATAQSDPRLLDALRIAQEGGSDSARVLVTTMLRTTPPTDTLYPQVLYTMGLVSRNIEEMRRNYTRVSVEFANSSWADDAIYRMALLDYAGGNLPGATHQLERIRNDYPDSPVLGPAAEWAARSLFDQRKRDEACAWLAIGLERATEDIELRNRLEFLNGRCTGGPAGTPGPTGDSAGPASVPVTAPEPVPARTGFGVQVAAVNTQAAADKVAGDLRGAGFTPYIVREGALFKVRAGPYPDRARASAAAEQIRQKLRHSPFVVPEP